MYQLKVLDKAHSVFVDVFVPLWRILVVAAWTLYFMINDAMPTKHLITTPLPTHHWIFPCQLVTHPTDICLVLMHNFTLDQIIHLPHPVVF